MTGIWPSAARGAVLDALHRVDRPTLPRLTTAALKALAPYYRDAREESQDDETLRERMATLLHETANALKGDPGPLRAHDWSDLPRVAAELRAEVAAIEQRGAERLLDVLDDLSEVLADTDDPVAAVRRKIGALYADVRATAAPGRQNETTTTTTTTGGTQ